MRTRIGERVTVNGYPGIVTDENGRNVKVAFGPALGVRWVLSKHAQKLQAAVKDAADMRK